MADYLLLQSDARRIPLADRSVDLVIGSPPYTFARTYGIGAQRDCLTWVRWMLEVTAEAVRVSRGLVLWIVAGQTRDHCYEPSPEGLLWEWWSKGVGSGVFLDGIELPMRPVGECQCWRPAYWNRVGIPGSGGKKWLRADVEYILCFKAPGNDFWTDNTAMGKPPKFEPGGQFSHRGVEGKRCYRRDANGDRAYQPYVPPKKANPGNLIRTTGGHLGNGLAHESEAPFPEALVEFSIRSFCPPGGTVVDPFSGSGTTAAVASQNGRRAIGLDIRRFQCELGHRRIADSLRPVSRYDPPPPLTPLPGQGDLFSYIKEEP